MSSGQYVQARQLVSLAAPIAGIQLAQVALTTTDIAMMGLLGVQAIAAGGLAITLYNQIRTMCVGVVTAVGNLVAMAVGAAEGRTGGALDDRGRAEVRAIVRAAFLVATVVGVLAATALIAAGAAVGLLGGDDSVFAQARPMMIALAFGLPPMLWLNVLRQFAVGMKRPGSLLGLTIVSVGANALLNAAFIFGWMGLPALGLVGIGCATSFVNLLMCLGFAAMARRDPVLAPLLSMAFWRADRADVGRIVRLGVPVSLTYGSEAGIFSVAAMVMGGFGAAALAAHNIVIQLTYIVFQVTIGLSHGSSILVSGAVGRGAFGEAARVARSALTVGGAVMAVAGALYVVAPEVVIRPFLDAGQSAEVLPIARALLLIAIVQQFVDCAQNIGVGLLRGLGDTKSGLTITLFGYWVVALPLLLGLAFGLHLDGVGVWLALCAGLTVTATLLLTRFARDLRSRAGAAPVGPGR